MRSRLALIALLALACQSSVVKPGASGPGPAPVAPELTPPPSPATGGISIPDAGAPPPSPSAMACARESHRATRAAVDLVLLVDASSSMEESSGKESKWVKAQGALSAFVQDPGSAGLGVGLAFFPGDTTPRACHSDAECDGFSQGTGNVCRYLGWCYAPGLPVLTNRACAPGANNIFNCPGGMTCHPQGRCKATGAACVEGASDTCAAGDSCETTAGTCRAPSSICQVASYGQLDVPVADLPAHAPTLVNALMSRTPDGLTPMAVALDSVARALAARRAAAPYRKQALVLATDGLPSCDANQTVDAVVARIAEAAQKSPGVPTYVVGVFAPSELATAEPALKRFASAGGTSAPYLLTTGDDLSQRLLEALKQIRGLAVACDYAIPTPMMDALDLGKVNVSTTAMGQAEALARVSSADRCGGNPGWYYDPPVSAGSAMPSRLVLCPQSCARLKGDAAAHVDLEFGCATRTID
jgi:hypothetical protein